jgi:hypothetical protein
MWEIYGGGVSMFLDTAMKDGRPDQFGNRPHTFDQHRLGFNVAKTGWRQTIEFEQVVIAAEQSARSLGWSFSKANIDSGCAT